MKLSMKHLDGLCIAAIIMVTILCGYLAVSSGIQKKRMIQEQNDRVSRRLKDINLAETNLRRLNAILDSAKEELASLNRKIPESAAIGLFLKEIDSLIKQRDIALVRLQPLPDVKEELFTRIPIQFKFKGAFVKVYEFLRDLETMSRTVVIEKMMVRKSKLEQECDVDLTADIFER